MVVIDHVDVENGKPATLPEEYGLERLRQIWRTWHASPRDMSQIQGRPYNPGHQQPVGRLEQSNADRLMTGQPMLQPQLPHQVQQTPMPAAVNVATAAVQSEDTLNMLHREQQGEANDETEEVVDGVIQAYPVQRSKGKEPAHDVLKPNKETNRILKEKIAKQSTAGKTRVTRAGQLVPYVTAPQAQPSRMATVEEMEEDEEVTMGSGSGSTQTSTQPRPSASVVIAAANPPHDKKRKEPAKTLRPDNYFRQYSKESRQYGKAEDRMFWMDLLMRAQLPPITTRDLFEHIPIGARNLYQRIANDADFIDELEEYRLQDKGTEAIPKNQQPQVARLSRATR
jgi:hypothetical protein